MCAYSIISDRTLLEEYLRLAPDLNIYHLGDLDDFFWRDTRWYAQMHDEVISALALCYSGEKPSILLAITPNNSDEMALLLNDLVPDLADKLYAHLSPGLIRHFQSLYDCQHNGKHYKMSLVRSGDLDQCDTSAVIPLGLTDLPRLEALYAKAYPGNWFNPRMLESGKYVGISDEDGQLLSVAGVHVFSPYYRVAALGNITTLPEQRGRGLGIAVTAGCCQLLLEQVDLIGLNVRCDNQAAIRVYQKVGFEVVGEYDEWVLTRN